MWINEQSSPEEKEEFFAAHPQRLYKYRAWGDDYHKRLFTHNELYLSRPERFNDPYDCGLPFNQHPENSDPIVIKGKVEQTAINRFPDLIYEPQALEEECARQVLLIQQDPTAWFEETWGYNPKDLNELFGVLSLTPHPNNYLMWSHYSDSHRGFCAEFQTRLLVESINTYFKKVDYKDTLPLFSIKDTLEQGLLDKLLYTKSTLWQYEDEYRFSKIHYPDCAVNFNPQALTAVYFGCKMPFDHQAEIIDIVRNRYPWVKFRVLNINKTNFGLTEGTVPILNSV